jgi:hypothetical protein
VAIFAMANVKLIPFIGRISGMYPQMTDEMPAE